MPKNFKCEIVELSRINELCKTLAKKIIRSGFEPDVVVGISRGGLVPARLLCDYLHIHDLTSIKIQHYFGTERQEGAVLKYPLRANIKDKNVLLVDDVNDTGKSLVAALEHLNEFGAKDIRTAVMHEKAGSLIKVNYFAETLNHWRWLIYEWATVEDINSFNIYLFDVNIYHDENFVFHTIS